MLNAWVYKEFSIIHGKVCYILIYPVHTMNYVRCTLHDKHVNQILINMTKQRKYHIKIGPPSRFLTDIIDKSI